MYTVRDGHFHFATIWSCYHDDVAGPETLGHHTVQTLILFLSLRQQGFGSLVACHMPFESITPEDETACSVCTSTDSGGSDSEPVC